MGCPLIEAIHLGQKFGYFLQSLNLEVLLGAGEQLPVLAQ